MRIFVNNVDGFLAGAGLSSWILVTEKEAG